MGVVNVIHVLTLLCSKTVIITGSQVPLTEVRNDALDNLLGALTIAGHFLIPEVCLYFRQKLYRGNRSSKLSAVDFDAFDSPNMPCLVEVGIDISKSSSILYSRYPIDSLNRCQMAFGTKTYTYCKVAFTQEAQS